MNRRKLLCLLAAVCCLILFSPSRSQAAVNVVVNIGPAPVCPYGYYGYAPYNCAPYGYYGPMWFTNGIFIGAGPWFRGPSNFYGYVNNRFDPRYGYRGAFPRRGTRANWAQHRNFSRDFRGNQQRYGNGAIYTGHGRGNAYGHYKDHGNNGNHGQRNNGNRGNHGNNGNHGNHGNGRGR